MLLVVHGPKVYSTNQNKKDETLLKNEETIKKEEKLDGVDNFYNQIKEQIDLMFKKYKQG